ncbi:uncharacterized protein LOC111911959 [Lactuca sativa]|uniref:uncharacterized protein LOC111911959 n=1 Tax=Lactuca sativa TaxID=4236 RepID=UPI000CD95F9D|nr:uncharacterized protein LOC111911959 [Lactuca sativa]
MEMIFESYNCSDKQKTVFAIRQLKTGVLSRWELLEDTIPRREALRMSREAFMEQLKLQYCLEVDLIDLNNEFHNLKKRKMSVDDSDTASTERMKLFPYLVPTKLSKIEKFANRLPSDFGQTVKMATTLKIAVRAAKNVKTQLREKGVERAKVTCFKCGNIGHYTNRCISNKRMCYGGNEEGHISKDYEKKKEVARPNVPPRPKERAFQMTLEAERDEENVASVVEVASGEFIHVSNCIKNIIINLNGNKFHEELLPIKLNVFDIILGIYWLSVNDDEILCRKKMVRVNPAEKESFMVYGDKCRVNSGIISMMKAKKRSSKGEEAYKKSMLNLIAKMDFNRMVLRLDF